MRQVAARKLRQGGMGGRKHLLVQVPALFETQLQASVRCSKGDGICNLDGYRIRVHIGAPTSAPEFRGHVSSAERRVRWSRHKLLRPILRTMISVVAEENAAAFSSNASHYRTASRRARYPRHEHYST